MTRGDVTFAGMMAITIGILCGVQFHESTARLHEHETVMKQLLSDQDRDSENILALQQAIVKHLDDANGHVEAHEAQLVDHARRIEALEHDTQDLLKQWRRPHPAFARGEVFDK